MLEVLVVEEPGGKKELVGDPGSIPFLLDQPPPDSDLGKLATPEARLFTHSGRWRIYRQGQYPNWGLCWRKNGENASK